LPIALILPNFFLFYPVRRLSPQVRDAAPIVFSIPMLPFRIPIVGISLRLHLLQLNFLG
jgi:hypothetical protein